VSRHELQYSLGFPAGCFHLHAQDIVEHRACSTGTSGNYIWMTPPEENIFFLMVGVDGTSTESTWGKDSLGNHRNGGTASACAPRPTGIMHRHALDPLCAQIGRLGYNKP